MGRKSKPPAAGKHAKAGSLSPATLIFGALTAAAVAIGVYFWLAPLPTTNGAAATTKSTRSAVAKTKKKIDPSRRARLEKIPRENNISFAEFREKYLATSLPVIVSGAMEDWPASSYTFADIDAVCGARPLYTECRPSEGFVKYRHTTAAEKWGALATLPRDDSVLANVSQLIAVQADPSFEMLVHMHGGEYGESGQKVRVRGPELYLHDAMLELFCPELLEKLRAPRYFPVDYLRQIGPHRPPSDCLSYSFHPSLFLGAAHTQSGLHRDSRSSRFWMAVIKGTKTFRILDPADSLTLKARRPTECDERVARVLANASRTLRPNLVAETCPGFTFDLFGGDGDAEGFAAGLGPNVDGGDVRVWEGDVRAGDIIFIPEYWAHAVLNHDPTIAISYNFVDEYNLKSQQQLLAEVLDIYTTDTSSNQAERIKIAALLRQHFFEAEMNGFPAHAYRDVDAESAADPTWDEFTQNNAPPVSRDIEMYEEAMQAWLGGGGIKRMLATINEDRARGAAKVKSAR